MTIREFSPESASEPPLSPAFDDGSARATAFQQLLLNLSNRFARAADSEVVSNLEEAIREVRAHYRVDRISIWWLDPHAKVARKAIQFGVDAKSSDELIGPFSRVPWLTDRLYSGRNEPIAFPEDFPHDATRDREYFAGQSIRSCLIVPLSTGTEVVGIAGVGTLGNVRGWSEQDRVELTLLCRMLGANWIRLNIREQMAARERDLRKRADFQTCLAKISSDFATAQPEDMHQRIDSALSIMAKDYGFDRASLWRLDFGTSTARRLHEWAIKDEYRTADFEFPVSSAPWVVGCVLGTRARGPFRIPDDIPADSEQDVRYYQERKLKSGLIFPIIIEGKLAAVFGLAALNEKRSWDDRECTEMTLLCHTITSAWLRNSSFQQLKEREIDLARSQRVASVGSFVIHAHGEAPITMDNAVISLSAEGAVLFDVPHGELSVAETLERLHPEDRDAVLAARKKSVADGSGLELNYRVLQRDGTVLHIEDRAEVDRDESGRIVRVFGTYQDVTEQRRAREKLETALREIEKLKNRLQAENVALREEVRVSKSFSEIIGDSKPMRDALAAAQQVAPTGVTVLILGETGTGKEMVAKAVHAQSNRCDAPLISVNCAALSSDLIESELFGHEVGAFTGANQKRLGRFELAHEGTLFLDEIGDLPLSVQAKLLRVLQTGEVQRLGGNETLHVDVRVIAATNRNLADMVEKKTFRADLYFRINGFPVKLPPLRKRPEDIPALARHFVDKHAAEFGKRFNSISPATVEHLVGMHWPGNVRELEGYVQRALISSEGPVLDYIENAVAVTTSDEGPAEPVREGEHPDDLKAMHRRHITAVLDSCNWVIGGEQGAAAALGIPPSSLRSRMKRLGIERSS